jgi:hypothetical protein
MLTKEYRLNVFENKMLRTSLGAMKGEPTGSWRKLHYKGAP